MVAPGIMVALAVVVFWCVVLGGLLLWWLIGTMDNSLNAKAQRCKECLTDSLVSGLMEK